MADTVYRFVFEDDGKSPSGGGTPTPPPRATFPPSQSPPATQGSSEPGGTRGRPEERPIVRRDSQADPLRQFISELTKLPIVGSPIATGVNVYDRLASAAAALERLASVTGPLGRLGELGPIFRSVASAWDRFFGRRETVSEPIGRTTVETVSTTVPVSGSRPAPSPPEFNTPIGLPSPGEKETFVPQGSEVVNRGDGDLIIPPNRPVYRDTGDRPRNLPIVRPPDRNTLPAIGGAVQAGAMIVRGAQGGALSTAIGGAQAAQVVAGLGLGPIAVAAAAVVAGFAAVYKATEAFSSAITRRASELQQYSAALTASSVRSEIADMRSAIRSANNYGDTFARYNTTTADQNRALREIADGVLAKIADDIQPIRVILAEILNGIAALTPFIVKGTENTTDAIPYVKELKTISQIIEWLRGREAAKEDQLGVFTEFEKFPMPLDGDEIDAGTRRNAIQFNAVGGVELP